MFATCRHIMPSGRNCQSPAMRGSAFCYHHGRRIPPRGKGPSAGHRVPMPATLDRHGITRALHGVLQGLADDRISARRAAVLLQGLQMAASHPEDCAPRSDLFPPELFSSAIDTEEVVAAVNALAEKLALNPGAAPPPAVRPKP
jgi:hypothetical protein